MIRCAKGAGGGLKKDRERVIKKLRELNGLQHPCEAIDNAVKDKIKSAMEGVKQNDGVLYYEDPSSGNLAAKMCLLLGNVTESKETNADILGRFPDNITAQQLHVEILTRENKLEKAKQCLVKLKEVCTAINTKDPFAVFELCIHKADNAMYYYHIGPKFYDTAIDLYEEAVSTLEFKIELDSRKSTEKEKLLVIWKYKLIHLYDRMLNQGNMKLFAKQKEYTPVIIFHKICTLVKQVLESKYAHNIYQGRVYIEIMDAHQKLRGNTDRYTADFIRNAIGAKTVDDRWCMRRAQELAPEDGSVLEKIGRYYRIHAKNVNEFRNAESILLRCIELYPTRHVALHQLSQVYKSMWFEANNFEEARLHRNEIKGGKKDKTRGNRGRGGRGGKRNNAHSNLAHAVGESVANQTNHGISQAATGYTCNAHANGGPTDVACCESDPDEGIGEETIETRSPVGQKTLQIQSHSAVLDTGPIDITKLKITKSRTVPQRQIPLDRLPSQYSKPDYFDKLRTSNPLRGLNTVENQYLERAIAMLERANEGAKETANRYLVDLARLYISNGKDDKAEACFAKAEEKLEFASDHDRAYLYEQWALSRDYSGASGDVLEDIKRMYREAVACSIASREKSKMAFYNLKDIIDSQVHDNPNDLSIKREQALLQKMVANFDRAKGKLREIFEEDPGNVELLWDLIDVLYSTEQYLEAFEYLKMVFPLQSPEEIKQRHEDETNIHAVDPVSVTLKAMKVIDDSKNYIRKYFLKSLFIALTNPKDSQEKLDGTLFYDDGSFSEYSRTLHELFEEFGLRVINSISNPELFAGKTAATAYGNETLRKAACVVVIVDTLYVTENSDDEGNAVDKHARKPSGEMQLLHHLQEESTFRPILITCHEELGDEWVDLRRLKNFPQVSLFEVHENKCDESKQKFMEDFLRAIYANILDQEVTDDLDDDD